MLLLLDKNFYPFMQIILTHSSKIVDCKIPWIYFGNSYSKMKDWEKKLGSKRINLQNEVHAYSESQREPFLKWIEAQRISNNDSIHWWMTQIAGRNNSYSNFYLNLCQLLTIQDYLLNTKCQKEILIVCEDIFLLNSLYENFYKKFKLQISPFLKIYWFKDIFFLFFKGLINQAQLVHFFILHYFFARWTKPKKLEKPKGDITLIHHCLDTTNCFQDGLVFCKYFVSLPSWLTKQGVKVYALPWLYKNKPSVQFYRNLRQTNCLVPEDWLSLKDYFNIFKNSIKSLRTLKYKISYPDIKINHLVFRERLSQLGESGAVFWRYIPAIKKWSTNLKSITAYDQYENMIFEHPIRYIIKKLPIKSTSIGFYHSLVTKDFLAYHHLYSEWESSVKPDYVACLGDIGKNILITQGVPEKKLISVAALRHKNITNIKTNKKLPKQALIILSLVPEASIEILTKIYLNNSLIIDDLNLKIKVKTHPMMKVEKILKKMNWKNLPNGWEWAKRDLNSELKDSYCCFAMSTASVYDAILNDNIVISIKSDLGIMDNYLDLFSDKFSLANSVSGEELNKKIRDVFVLKTKEYQEEFSQMRSRLIEGINLINQENLNAFIPKN